jgi:hypothetical protein
LAFTGYMIHCCQSMNFHFSGGRAQHVPTYVCTLNLNVTITQIVAVKTYVKR